MRSLTEPEIPRNFLQGPVRTATQFCMTLFREYGLSLQLMRQVVTRYRFR